MELIRKTGLKDIHNEGRNRQCGIFRCSLCDSEVERSLVNGAKTKTCGKHTHNGHGTKIYWVWACMKQRCLNPDNKKYHRYGKRGISICNEWIEFKPFKKWALENGYKEGLQIDRIDNNGNYNSSNCRFVTNAENCRNKETTKLSIGDVENIRNSYDKGTSPKKLSKIYGVSSSNICRIGKRQSWNNIT